MARDPNIPLFLWVAAAIVTHLVWGGGAEQVADVFEERADVRRFAASVQQQLRRRFSTEIALIDDTSPELAEHDAEDTPPVPDAPADQQPADKVEPPKQPLPEQPTPDDVAAPERETQPAPVVHPVPELAEIVAAAQQATPGSSDAAERAPRRTRRAGENLRLGERWKRRLPRVCW